MNPLFRGLTFFLLLGTFATTVHAQSEKTLAGEENPSLIETALQRRLIDPELPLKEVQQFTEERRQIMVGHFRHQRRVFLIPKRPAECRYQVLPVFPAVLRVHNRGVDDAL